MRYRPFGRTGLSVSELGVGCSRIGGALSPGGSRKDEERMLRAALDAGINFFDTSDLYSQGQSEVVLGRALGRQRHEAIVATKGGYVVPGEQRLRARIKPLVRPIARFLPVRPSGAGSAGTAPMPQDFRPDHLVRAVDASLRRLATDHIDVYQLHSPSRSVVERDDAFAALERQRELGKIRCYGLALDSADTVRGFVLGDALASVQVPYSLLYPDAAEVLFPERSTQAPGFAIIARSCYAAGLFKDGLDEAALQQLTPDWPEIVELQRRAELIGRPLIEAALQFSLAPSAVSVTIIGMRTRAHLVDNLRRYDASPLTSTELSILRSAARDAR
jgi:aryl-alcohol dehydrogenase-like predicted oxidoreductase